MKDALELPDDLRVPLHGLQADAGWLIGRVAVDVSTSPLMLQSLENRLSQVAEAAYRLNGARASCVETLLYVVPALKVLRTMLLKAGLTLGAEKAEEMLQEVAKVLPHDWFRPDFIQYDCCRACGVVRRADGKSGPCMGPAYVGLRAEEESQTEALR